MENKGYKRRNYYISKGFQTRFIIKFCLILLAGVVVSTGLVLYFSQETLTSRFENSRLVIENTGDAIMPTLIATNLVTLCIITLAAIGVTLFVSHRIAGPMFRLEQDITDIAGGNLRIQIHLRKKDQFSQMARAVNVMVSNTHAKVSALEKDLAEAISDFEENKSAEDLKVKVVELKRKLNEGFIL